MIINCLSFGATAFTRKGRLMLVWIPLMNLLICLITMIVFACVQVDDYKKNLAEKYNETQGGTDDYLDTLHAKFSCCGLSDMELNVTGDPSLFKPAKDMLTIFPRSCCVDLAENDTCTFESNYQRTCDAEYSRKAHVFDFVAVSLLIISILWTIALLSVNKNEWESLFPHLTEEFQTTPAWFAAS